jgi:hypothetical protein
MRVGMRVETMDDSELPPLLRLDPGLADCTMVSIAAACRGLLHHAPYLRLALTAHVTIE